MPVNAQGYWHISGKGSGVDAWRAYSAAMHVAVPDGADRCDIVIACQQADPVPNADADA